MLQGRPNKTADLNQLLEPTQTCGGNLFDYFAPMHPLRILGKGAFGTVELYQVLPAAREFFTKKNFEVPDSVAIKELTYNRQNNVKSIASEIKTLSQLDRHPNIIQYYGCFINTDNQAYLVIEYFDG